MFIGIDRPSLAVIFAAYGSQCLLLAPYVSNRESAIRQHAATVWRFSGGAATSSASFAAFLYNQAIIVLTTCTILVAVWMAWTSPETRVGGLAFATGVAAPAVAASVIAFGVGYAYERMVTLETREKIDEGLNDTWDWITDRVDDVGDWASDQWNRIFK
ncbi:hypothetical protein [Actinomyces ruminis]|uniref:hypothetical protein n=1 Tax=Actinomyces ruminis TaxID=1937003 RepID=UPI0011787165|nr:hypothetical protein [Actinomyces ruminis]